MPGKKFDKGKPDKIPAIYQKIYENCLPVKKNEQYGNI
jgi:hypothetical protein